jgi:hypothetical protein
MITDHSKFEIHPELAKLLDLHEQATATYTAADKALTRASSDLATATENLGKWMVPVDAQSGEKFSVWLGAILFTVTYHKGVPAFPGAPGVADRYTISQRSGGKVVFP